MVVFIFLCLYLAIFVCACLLCLSVCILRWYKQRYLEITFDTNLNWSSHLYACLHVVIGIDLWLYLYFLCLSGYICVCMSFVFKCMYIAAVQKNGFS